MAYTALYRKWRPASFADVKGQDAIVTTLKNQIRFGRIGHAYLFCGTRGTGKTTIAKIFARAVNCEHPVDGDPCGECAACKAVSSGSSMNVVEIDAASNNGVDNIREIRDEVQYSPAEGSYRVYIIDEVHMLSAGAFNALLKTLEEPPSYVIFILATTEPHKIPVTVLSRCQRYDFRRISTEVLYERLRELTGYEKVEAEERALRYIAKKADGAMRDAISLLDQCIAFHMGEVLTYDKVLSVLGAVDNEIFHSFLDSLLTEDVTAGLARIEELVMSGRELSQFVQDFIWYLRGLMLLSSSAVSAEILDVTEEDHARMQQQAAQRTAAGWMRLIRIFSELYNQMRGAVNKRVLLEIAVVRTAQPKMEMNLESVEERLERLEKQIAEGVMVSPAAAPAPQAPVPEAEAPKTPEPVRLPAAEYQDLMQVKAEWDDMVASVREEDYLAASVLTGVRVEPKKQGVLCVVFFDAYNYNICKKANGLEQIRRMAEERLKKSLEFDMRLEQERAPEPEYLAVTDEDLSFIHGTIEYVDNEETGVE